VTEPLEPAERAGRRADRRHGRPLGWRGADVDDADPSGDDYAAQFTRHDPDAD
jgi:hypothetical protein